MTRSRGVWLLAALALCAALAATFAPRSRGDGDYRVDAVFDDARGLVAGQLVEVAGARVGTIASVSLTPDFKAQVHMKIDRRFAPFRADARCEIKPQGLIAENYVQCDPGSPAAPVLRLRGDQTPAVGVARTTEPVSLTDLFEIWNAPTRERLQILLSTLGIATAGRGDDLNAILRRVNPALAQARRTIALLERQRHALATTTDATADVAARLARRPQDLRGLVRHAARVATQTARHSEALGAGVRALPGLLRAARPALRKLDATVAAARPLADQLTAAAPAINRVSADVPRLVDAAAPALARLAPVLRRGATTSRRAAPVVKRARTYAAGSLPSVRLAAEMFPTVERRGFVRNFLTFVQNMALAMSRYDATSHVMPSHLSLTDCGIYAQTPSAGCGSPLRASRRRTVARPAPRRTPQAATTPTMPTAPAAPAAQTPPPVAVPVQVPRPVQTVVDDLLDFLLG